ncbi:MAG: NADH-quinone oxidoreductase subunit M [Anaerolineae bacterium]|nr:NADH-quinone oxidoreductase subunit M [Anaerolineae bacterium]
MNFPLLSVITFTPALAAVVLLMLPKDRKDEARVIAAVASFFTMALCIWAYFSYDRAAGGFQFVEQVDWIPAIGTTYHVGVDGISLPLLLLNGVVAFTGVLISWGVDDRPNLFFAFLFLVVTGVFGVFVSLDLFYLFFAYELAVFPMYLLISMWGWKKTRNYAAMKLTLYLLIGSIVALVGILAFYFEAGLQTFDILALREAGVGGAFQKAWFLPVFLGFGVLAGVWPFHSWSPDGHVAAPSAGSMVHAGVLMKVGAYSALRVGVELFPEGAQFWLPYVILLTLVNVVYGSMIALAQEDFKYVIGFSSVSHMGLVSMGFATMSPIGLSGAALQMFSHGVMTALFFAVVGMVYDRAHTRHIPDLGGFAKIMPMAAVAFIIGGLVSMGMPGFSGFIAEVQIFLGLWQARNLAWWYPWVAVLASTGIIFTAAYVLRVVQRVFFGKLKPEYAGLPGISVLDKVALGILCTILVVVGIYPRIITGVIELGVTSTLALLGGG